jgi:sugar transferase (PEP-CTERM/EpsH1 system associated)
LNILFLSPRIPEPPNKGDKIRSHHFMRRIASRHEVHLACLLDDESEIVHVEAAERWAASVTWRLRSAGESALRGAVCALTGRPLSAGWFRSGGLRGAIRRLRRERRFDVAVAYCSSMAPYLHDWRSPRVVDLVDVDSEKWRQYADRSRGPKRVVYALEHRLLRGYEARVVREFDRIVIISLGEREILGRFADASRVDVVTNGVDVDAFARPGPRGREPVLVFVGALDYFANAEGIAHFVREAWPDVRERVPGTRLRIVGRRPGSDVRSLGSVAGVDVVGEVDDVRPELWRASLAVVPLRIAQGLQNKVLEAMAAGLPVLTSPAAVRGVEGEAPVHFRVAETPKEWADGAELLLRNREAAEATAGRALELVRSRYSWDRKAGEYERILAEAAGMPVPPVRAGATD